MRAATTFIPRPGYTRDGCSLTAAANSQLGSKNIGVNAPGDGIGSDAKGGGSGAAAGAMLHGPARSWRPWLRWLAVIGWAVVTLVAAHRLAPRLNISPLVAYAIGFMVVALSALGAAWRCPAVKPRALVAVVPPCAALLWLSAHPPAELDMAVAVTVCLLLACTLVGAVVGGAIEHAGQLVFVAIVSSAADVFSVFHPSGPSAAIVHSEVALSVLALPWPMLGTPFIEPILGAGDVVFTSLYVASSRRHALSAARTALALTLAFAVTMVAVVALEAALPALPFLGLAIVVAHPEARRPPERDRLRGYVVAAVVVAAVAGLLLI